MDTKHVYIDEYNAFLANYHRGEISAEEVGEIIVKMASHFSQYNMNMVLADRKLAKIARDIECRTDENGKAISSAKAKIFTDATEEAGEYSMLKAHKENIEQFINALKALQRGLMNEFAYAGT